MKRAVDGIVDAARIKKANDLRTKVTGLVRQINRGWFELADVLATIRQERLYKDLEYTRFEDYVRTELPFGARKAWLLLQVHRRFVEDLKYSKRELERLVLSKAIAVLPVISRKNSRIWYQRMLETPFPALKMAVREARGKTATGRVFMIHMNEAGYNRVMRVMDKLGKLGFKRPSAKLCKMAELAEMAL